MIAVYIIGGVLVVAGVVWGIVAFKRYTEEVYEYNIFNMPNLLMLLVMSIIWIILLILRVNMEVDPLNYLISGIVTGVVLIVMFIRNLRQTSLPVAIGALVLQVATTSVIILIVAGTIFFSGRRQE